MTEPPIRRAHSSSVFTLVALCFLLPFATVSIFDGCGGPDAPPHTLDGRTSFTGIQLVTHTVPRGSGTAECGGWRRDGAALWSPIDSCVERGGAVTAEIAFAAALLGLVLAVLGVAAGPGLCAAVGIGALLQLPLSPFGGPLAEISWRVGYWLALTFFGWAALLHFVRWRQRRPAGLRTGTGPRGALIAIAISLLAVAVTIVCLWLHVLWLAPLIWAGGIVLLRAAKEANRRRLAA